MFSVLSPTLGLDDLSSSLSSLLPSCDVVVAFAHHYMCYYVSVCGLIWVVCMLDLIVVATIQILSNAELFASLSGFFCSCYLNLCVPNLFTSIFDCNSSCRDYLDLSISVYFKLFVVWSTHVAHWFSSKLHQYILIVYLLRSIRWHHLTIGTWD